MSCIERLEIIESPAMACLERLLRAYEFAQALCLSDQTKAEIEKAICATAAALCLSGPSFMVRS